MTTTFRHIFCLVAAAILSAAAPASALTLGKARAGVVLGRPLSVVIPVQGLAEDDATASCFSADVFYGDNRVGQGEEIAILGRPNADTLNIQISHTKLVSEPIVTVRLNAQCGSKTSREYVFFAEIATGVNSTLPVLPAKLVPNISVPSVPSVPSVQNSTNSSSTAKATVDAVGATSTVNGGASVGLKSKKADVGRKRVANVIKKEDPSLPARGDGAARLQVLAPVPSPSLVPSLSADAKSAVDDLSKRVEALDAWQAANSNAQDVLKDSRRLSSLEADISGLKTLAARNAQVLSSANDRLSHIESQRFSGTTVYGLMAVLALSLVGLGVLWRRSVNVSGGAGAPWWSSVGKKSDAVAEGANAASSLTYEEVSHLGEDLTDQPHAAKSSSKHDADGESSLDIDLNLGESVFPIVEPGKSDSASSVLPTLTDAHLGGRREFANSGIGTLRAVNTKEMLDVRQQAEFFMTLGQHDEAVKILEASIQNSDESNPLVYLDLLKVLHTLSKKSEFERYREEFNRQFTGIVPAYASFIGAEGALEEYPDICRQLSELWPNEDAVDYIEFCLVRSADIPTDQGLELEAFKDLLMLHGVIRRLESMVDSGMVPFSAPRSVASQLPETEGKTFLPSPISFQHSVVPPLPVIEVPPLTEELDLPLDLNLDLDLSEKSEPKDNLIEFDLSGYPLSASGATVPPKG